MDEDDDYGAEIDLWRSELRKGLAEALAGLRVADAAFQRLVDGLYDVEFAEGRVGDDLGHYLSEAARALRVADLLRAQATREPSDG